MVLVLFASTLVASDSPAPAWYRSANGCTWGPAPAIASYEYVGDATDPIEESYRNLMERAIHQWNGFMDWRMDFYPIAHNDQVMADFRIDFARLDSSYDWVGAWSGAPCWEYGGRWMGSSVLTINRTKLDQFVDPTNPSVDWTVAMKTMLHELGHSIGLDHENLNVGWSPMGPPSSCIIMSAGGGANSPFVKGHECENQGEALKYDDISGAWALYPPPDACRAAKPPSASSSVGVAAANVGRVAARFLLADDLPKPCR